jgi:methyl-accepting chemotaxis protein
MRCFVAITCVFLFTSNVVAEELTAKLCKEKVMAAAKLIEAEGNAALAKIKDENGEFRFAGGEGYLWVHNLDLVMVMHPVKPALDGQDISGTADPDGTYLFSAMNEVVEEHGSGWVPYKWPKPGQKVASDKVSFVKLVKHGDKDYVVGAGLYDVTAADVKKEFAGDAIYEP